MWTTTKPEFKEDCVLIAASKIGEHWDYSLFIIQKEHSDEGWYWGIFTGDGEEWGDINDLEAHLYQIIEPLK